MLNVILQMAVSMAVTVLRQVIKNPSSVKEEGAIVSELAQLATQADTAVNGTVWNQGTSAAS
jgi:hypothetical protein